MFILLFSLSNLFLRINIIGDSTNGYIQVPIEMAQLGISMTYNDARKEIKIDTDSIVKLIKKYGKNEPILTIENNNERIVMIGIDAGGVCRGNEKPKKIIIIVRKDKEETKVTMPLWFMDAVTDFIGPFNNEDKDENFKEIIKKVKRKFEMVNLKERDGESIRIRFE